MMLTPAEKAARIVDGLAIRATEITDRLREQVVPLVPDVLDAKDAASARAIMQPFFDRAAEELRELIANSVAHLESTEH